LSLKFVITGNPCSSKNSIRSGITKQGRNYTYTKKDVKDYRDSALKQLNSYIDDGFYNATNGKKPKFILNDINGISFYVSIPIIEPVQVSFLFYCKDARKRDLCNLIQCPADLLQQAGIIENDCLIQSLDGSRIMGIDKDNPRTEITINEI
jgi:Holliday junction resolvase RusA-like endonuclease